MFGTRGYVVEIGRVVAMVEGTQLIGTGRGGVGVASAVEAEVTQHDVVGLVVSLCGT